MNTYLKPFELTLRCLGPVFIGSGEKRTSKEYHVEGDRVYFPDMELLYADIPAHKRKSFEAFVMNTDWGTGDGATQRVGRAKRGQAGSC